MGHLKPLCNYCAKVPLRDAESSDAEKSWSLGSGMRIKNSECPLCQVIVSASQALYQTDSWHNTTPLSEQSDVSIHRYSAIGPAGRSGFTIDPSTLQTWICVAQSTSRPEPDPMREFLCPAVGAEFDVGRLEDWITACTRFHSDERCGVKAGSFSECFPGLEVVRFIDVKLSAIVELRCVPRYITLSYVWGETSGSRLTTISRAAFLATGGSKQPGNASPGPSRMP